MSVLAVLSLAAVSATVADAAAPRPQLTSATATARVEILRFERAAPEAPGAAVVLQRQVDPARREVAFY